MVETDTFHDLHNNVVPIKPSVGVVLVRRPINRMSFTNTTLPLPDVVLANVQVVGSRADCRTILAIQTAISDSEMK